MDIMLWNHTVYSVSCTLGFYALVQLYENISYFPVITEAPTQGKLTAVTKCDELLFEIVVYPSFDLVS